MNYAEIAFSDAAKRYQERYGSRVSYARMEQRKITDGLSLDEEDFIAVQDNFYMGTVGESGFPYIQFRGGPKGFLKVLDDKTLGFIDFGGNKQYISVGNLATNNKVSLFILDQAAKARLKIYATAEVLEIAGNEKLYQKLDLDNYKFIAERIIILHVEAYDWNCPQHITERYTLDEIRDEFVDRQTYIDELKAENEALKKQLAAH